MRAFALSLLLAAASCTAIRGDFVCHGDDSCFDGTRAGSCEATGFCAFADLSCPSGRRYGIYAGGGLARMCVGATVQTDGGGTTTCGLLGDPCCADMSCPALTCDTASNVCTGCVLQLALGDNHGCALKHDGTVWCWGKNDHGQIGDGTTTDRPNAVQVLDSLKIGIKDVVGITAGANHTCVLQNAAAGQILCWGDDSSGQLGRAAGNLASNPVPDFARLSSVIDVAAGGHHTCAITGGSTNQVWCWGADDSGQLATSADNLPSAGVSTPTAAVDGSGSGLVGLRLGGGLGHTCLVKLDHSLWCWGSDTAGELGDSQSVATGPATQVAVLGTHVDDVALGAHVTCAITDDGQISCMGLDDHAQAGQPDGSPVKSPMTIGVDAATAVALGGTQGCARRVGGRLNCWGNDAAPMDVQTGIAAVGVGASDRCVAQASAIACTTAMPRLSCP